MHAKPNCWAARHALSRSARSLQFPRERLRLRFSPKHRFPNLRHSTASLLMGQGNPQAAMLATQVATDNPNGKAELMAEIPL